MKKRFYSDASRAWCWFVANIIICIFLSPGLSSAFTLSGTINLPITAGVDGIDIDIYLEETEGYSYTAQTFTVSNGNNSVAYSLTTGTETTRRVRYVCLANCGDMFPVGYVTAAGTSYKYEDARTFNATTSVSFTLPLGYRVEGVVKLPGLDTADSGIGIEVTAQQTDNYYSLTDNILISAGGTSASYSLLLPPDLNGFWILYYNIPTKLPTTYYHTGYFVTPLSTTYVSTDAVKLYGSTTYTGRDLILLRGKTVEGKISFPPGRVAPAGGIEINMESMNYDVYGGEDKTTVTIPEGGSSGNYTLIIPEDQNRSWHVRYGCSGYFYSTCLDAGYLTVGYYSGQQEPTFFVWRQNYGRLWGAESHVGVDLTLIPSRRIGGKVTIPDPAPPGGLYLTAYADDPVYPGAMSDTAFIPAGAKSVTYEVAIPEDSSLSWRVLHRFWDKVGYIQQAYYATAGTTHLKNKATMLNGGTDHFHIDMAAIPDQDNDGIPDSIDPIRNMMNPGVLLLLQKKP